MAPPSELIDYVRAGLAHKVPRAQLTEVLTQHGWAAEAIADAFSAAEEVAAPAPSSSFPLRTVAFSAALVAVFVVSGFIVLRSPLSPTQASDTASDVGVPVVEAADLSTTTPERIISQLSIKDVVPAEGKFIGADLEAMEVYLYQDGKQVAEYPILTKGRAGTPYETPSGAYQVLTKEQNHFSSLAGVYMPYSMQFYGNYFIHGWPYYADGTPVASTYSGGCIRLSTDDAAKVYAFADVGTKLFVHDSTGATTTESLAIGATTAPPVSAASYLVADIDTGEVYAEKDAEHVWPIASVTKLMTALVANETINYEQHVPTTYGNLEYPQVASSTKSESVVVGKLMYPLIMESNNATADALAHYYGTTGFVSWMNSTAASLDMTSTHYADPSGISSDDTSTVDDLYRLAVYLATKKSFIFDISRLPSYTLTTDAGDTFPLRNFNVYSADPSFIGGKVGQTEPAKDTMVSLFTVPGASGNHRIAIIVLQSDDYAKDTSALLSWIREAAGGTGITTQAACTACAGSDAHRTIQL